MKWICEDIPPISGAVPPDKVEYFALENNLYTVSEKKKKRKIKVASDS